MTEKRLVNIILEDDFGRVQTKEYSDLNLSNLMDKIVERIMTEKRFTLIKDTGTDECYSDNLYDNGTYIGAIDGGSEMICYLLNALHEENIELQLQINYLEGRLDDCICLKKENKDLKEENLELSQKILKGLFEDENDELRKENKKLKEELEWCRMTVDGLKGE